MSEAHPKAPSLVTWEQPEVLGKLAGSEWQMGPDCRTFRPVRDFYLEGERYPEGYIAAVAVDAETGERQTAPRFSYRFRPPCHCGSGDPHSSPSLTVSRSQRPVDIGGGKLIRAVYNAYGGVPAEAFPPQTYIDPASGSKLFRRTLIAPGRNMLFAEDTSETDDNRLRLHLQIQQGKVREEPSASITISMSEPRSGIMIACDAGGELVSLKINRPFILEMLGLVMRCDFDRHGQYLVENAVQRADILNTALEYFGGSEWHGMDLRQSASKLYTNLGRGINPVHSIIARPN